MLGCMHPRATLAATILGSSLAFIDGSVVNVALPALAADLRVDPVDLSWAINAYLLPLGALILLGGALGDHFGRRRFFQIGLLIFTLASAGCAVAPSLAWFLAARGLQGLGAALLLPNSLALLGGGFTGEVRGRAIGTWAAAGALAGALGPIVGGWIIDTIGWRTIFLLNLPLAAGAGFLAWMYVQERKESRAAAPLDAVGAALVTTSLGLLTWALTKASESGGGHAASGSAICGALLFGVFLWHERRIGERAIMPFALFSSPAFVGLTLLTFFLYGSLGGLLVLLPFFSDQNRELARRRRRCGPSLPVPVLIGLGSRFMGRVGGPSRRTPAAEHGRRSGRPGTRPVRQGSGGRCGLLHRHLSAHAAGGLRHGRLRRTAHHLGHGVGGRGPCGTGIGVQHAPLARIAGLAATASLGFVFARQESSGDFMRGFRAAAFIGAASAVLAAASSLWLVKSRSAPGSSPPSTAPAGRSPG